MKKRAIAITAGMVLGAMVLGTAGTAFAAGITVEDAQRTALEAAGVTEDQVVFEKRGTDVDDGREIFEIDFLVPGEMKFDFDIDASTGAIVDRDMDLWEADDDFEYAALIGSMENAAESSAKEVSGEVTELQAKSIALKDAGFTAAEVTFTKCEKDFDDGAAKYDVDFRVKDGREFEYDIRISDGTILDRDVDLDD